MQGETADAAGYANAAVAQPFDEDLAEAAIDAFANLATATAVDRGIVATLTEAKSCVTKQLEDSSKTLKEIRGLLKKECNDHSSRKTFAPANDNYCWTRGYNIARNHTSENCLYPKMYTNKRQTKTITLEAPKPTKNDW
jgi:hypothetical protein